ncbi:MAG: NrfD/PsrC family molybdoenzyme membrane anchor subunit [Pyrobaculum sp.]
MALDAAELSALFALVSLHGGSRGARESASALAYGDLAPLFWIGVVALGIVAPLLTGFYLLKRENKYAAYAAALLALIGALLLRVAILQAGVFEPLT